MTRPFCCCKCPSSGGGTQIFKKVGLPEFGCRPSKWNSEFSQFERKHGQFKQMNIARAIGDRVQRRNGEDFAD